MHFVLASVIKHTQNIVAIYYNCSIILPLYYNGYHKELAKWDG